MYIVSVAVNSIVFSFTFKAHKNADDFFRKAAKAEGRVEIEDDYGSKGSFDTSKVAVNFTDVCKDSDMQGEMQILRQKSMLKAQTAANNDIGLQLLQKSANPSLIKQ